MRLRRRRKKTSKVLLCVLAAVMTGSVFIMLGMFSDISRQSEINKRMQKEIAEMQAEVTNMEIALGRFHNLDEIREKADALGMIMPDNAQIRVIQLPAGTAADNSAQTASISNSNSYSR